MYVKNDSDETYSFPVSVAQQQHSSEAGQQMNYMGK